MSGPGNPELNERETTMAWSVALLMAFALVLARVLVLRVVRPAPVPAPERIDRIYVCNRLPEIGQRDYGAWIKTNGGCVPLDGE